MLLFNILNLIFISTGNVLQYFRKCTKYFLKGITMMGGGGHLPYELRDEVEVEREVHHGDH